MQAQPVPTPTLTDEYMPASPGAPREEVDLFPLYDQLSEPYIPGVSEAELKYCHFFITQLPVIWGVHQMFPSFLTTIFARSLGSKNLYFMVLAVSSYLLDRRLQRSELQSYKYLQQGLPLIKSAIEDGICDDALIYSVFLAAYLHQICGEIATSRRHLEGLYLLLRQHRVIPGEGEISENNTPELKLVWRLAIQLDHMWAIGEHNLVFPISTKQDDVHREWIGQLVDLARPEMAEWALSQFALDDMLSKAISVMNKATQLRSLPKGDSVKTEQAIATESESLLEAHVQWLDRPCIKSATEKAISDSEDKLLILKGLDDKSPIHYPATRITNKGFGALMVQYFWVLMYITFIKDPRPGAGPHERFQAALDLCSTYEAIGCKETFGIGRMVLGLYITGLTLGESSKPKGKQSKVVSSSI
jgi:hypothetical protein